MALKPASKKYPGVWTNELKNGNVAYYINYRDENGKPVKKKVGVKTKQSNYTVKDAYDRLIEVKHKLSTGDESPIKPQRKKKLPFGEVFEHYLSSIKNTKKSWKDDESIYENHLKHLEKRDIKSLKLSDFEELQRSKVKEVSDLTGKPLSQKTVNNILATARQIINYAIKYELVKNYINPIANGKLKMFKPDNQRNNFFTKEQALKLLEKLKKQPNVSLYRLTVLLLFTGARFGEVASLRWSDINFETKMIYFKPTKDGNARWIIMNEIVLDVVQGLKSEKNSDLIITNLKGTQFTEMPDKWQEIVDELIEGNKNASRQYRLTPHSLRHTHASWLAMGGLDILHIRDQLGHKKIDMTMRYAHLIPNKRHDATLELLLD